ncbi:MAG: tetratricopeptide repeat protein, partial [Acidobacteriota bacterium]
MDLTLGPGTSPPFHQLGDGVFEELCRDLLREEPGIATCDTHGISGQTDCGVDVLATLTGQEGHVVGQCKAYREFREQSRKDFSKVTEAFFKHLELWKDRGVDRFILMVGCDLDRTQHQDAIDTERRRFSSEGIEYEVWSSATIAAKLEPHPSIVRRYCEPPDAWVERLCGAPRVTSTGPGLVGVPDPSQHFVGREEDLATLRDLLTQGDTAVSASIAGLAGIGKTELAIHLAHQLHRDEAFPGGIFWLTAEDPDLTLAWGGGIADRLDVPEGPVGERALAVTRRISQQSDPVLIILDNVEEWTNDAHPHPLPEGAHVTKLVTTRRSDLGGTRFKHQRLDVLADDNARKLLLELSGREPDAEGLDDLLDYLGGHSLAVALAGSYLREYDEPIPKYLEQLRVGADVDRKVAKQTRYEATTNAAFGALWENLDEPTRRAWQLAACFAPESVGSELSDAAGLDADARRVLRRFHLIDQQADARWRMHRLTRAFGQGAGKKEELQAALRAFVGGCAERVAGDDWQLRFREYVPERGHIDLALEQARSAGLGDRGVARFQRNVGSALHGLGELQQASDLYWKSLELLTQCLEEGDTELDVGRSYHALALKALGDLQGARELHEQALESGLKNLGEDHPNVAARRSNLALVLKALGDLPRAKELLEQALESDLKNLGEDHPSVTTSRSNLASVLQALGDLPRAKKLHEQALESCLQNLGEEHPEVARSRSNLASVLQALGDLSRAKELLEQALESDLKNLGEDHPNVA